MTQRKPLLSSGYSDAMNYAQDYSTLLKLFVRLVETQAGRSIGKNEEWLNDAQVLSVKLFRHLASMQILAAGAQLRGEAGTAAFIDHASIKVICRAALETYLVFFYVYGQDDESLCKFRHTTWRLAGLCDRQKFHVTTQEHQDVLSEESSLISQLQAEVQASPWMNKFTPKQQREILKGNWRPAADWNDLGADAGFHPKYFKNVYSYLCSYSHASYLSALQVGQAKSRDTQEQLSQTILGIGVVLMAHFAFSYSGLFGAAKAALHADQESARIAEKWCIGHSDMATHYGS